MKVTEVQDNQETKVKGDMGKKEVDNMLPNEMTA